MLIHTQRLTHCNSHARIKRNIKTKLISYYYHVRVLRHASLVAALAILMAGCETSVVTPPLETRSYPSSTISEANPIQAVKSATDQATQTSDATSQLSVPSGTDYDSEVPRLISETTLSAPNPSSTHIPSSEVTVAAPVQQTPSSSPDVMPEKIALPTVKPHPTRSSASTSSQAKPNLSRIILPASARMVSAPIYKDGRNVPAYRQLMRDYIAYLRKNDLVHAEMALLHAQRLAPQSADVYRELARLANLKKQSMRAEVFARKGLMFAVNTVQKRQLWKQILSSAQLRLDTQLIKRAKSELLQYK